MKITKIETEQLTVPLKRPFKTALRTVSIVDDVLVKIFTDAGAVGYGEAAPTPVITGETGGSIIWAVEKVIAPKLVGMEIANLEALLLALEQCLVKNTSAKAAVDMAIYDLYGQLYRAPLYKLLGGFRDRLATDITISLNDPEQMALDSLDAVQRGYDILKIKVGLNPGLDLARISAIRKTVGAEVKLRVDANQGWRPKEAVQVLRRMEDEGLGIELVEQPVIAHDLEGLKFVTDHVSIPVLADESVFSPEDALKIMQLRAADLVNIKLMKTGGIHNALKICSLAEIYGVECMIGCMMESKISVSAAAHLAAARSVITRVDLDGPALCDADPIAGGAFFNERDITFSDQAGLGFGGL